MNIRADFVYRREYRGGVRGVVLDWSGTVADAYVIAPAVVFVDVFRKHGVEISMSEARGPMGLRKDLHIQKLTEDPAIRERWKEAHGKHPGDAEVAAMFADFVPMQLACLPEYAGLLPGAAEAAEKLRKDYGLKIGMSTGFTRAMVDVLLAETKKQGYHPDAAVAGDEVEHGARPRPFMVYRNLDLLDLSPIQSVVKVDDTVSGVGEGLEAGCWSVGVSRYSNYMDIDSIAQEKALPAGEIERRHGLTREILRKSGAHYVIDSIADLPEVIDDVNHRLSRGEKP